MKETPKHQDRLLGCLLGTAVGDALGLAGEGIPAARAERMFPDLDRPRFLFGRGMISDDTEHTCMVAQALIASGGDPERFGRSLAWRLRGWLLCLPAGTGMATARAILRLLVGFPHTRSGVYSAGNGPAMRSAIIGAAFSSDEGRMRDLVATNTRITHTDPQALDAALAVAVAAALARESLEGAELRRVFRERLSAVLKKPEVSISLAPNLLDCVDQVIASVERGQSTREFADSLGLGKAVSGYAYHTLPVVLHAWLTHPLNYRAAVESVIRCGGDTDTTAAIVGGIVGTSVGREGIPQIWLDSLWEWPRTPGWMARVAGRLAEAVRTGKPGKAVPLFWPALLVRNPLFLAVVLAHGFRRLAPPYSR